MGLLQFTSNSEKENSRNNLFIIGSCIVVIDGQLMLMLALNPELKLEVNKKLAELFMSLDDVLHMVSKSRHPTELTLDTAERVFDKINKIKGLNITIVTTAKTDEEGRQLIKLLGMPFKN